MSGNFFLTNKTKSTLPRVDFVSIKNYSLGEKYVLHLNIVPANEIQRLNLIYRNMDKPTDILSFPLSENEGEIYICLSETRKEAKKFDREFANFVAFLFVHGCTHLKGYDHGGKMESIEADIRKKFGI